MTSDSTDARVDGSSDVAVGKDIVQQVVNVNSDHHLLNERLTRLEERIGRDEDMSQTAIDNQPYTLLRLETKVDRVLERQESIISEQAELKRRMGTVESMAQGFQRQSPTIDRVMVAMLAVAMLGMLAFNMMVFR